MLISGKQRHFTKRFPNKRSNPLFYFPSDALKCPRIDFSFLATQKYLSDHGASPACRIFPLGGDYGTLVPPVKGEAAGGGAAHP